MRFVLTSSHGDEIIFHNAGFISISYFLHFGEDDKPRPYTAYYRLTSDPLQILTHLESFYRGNIPTKSRKNIPQTSLEAIVTLAKNALTSEYQIEGVNVDEKLVHEVYDLRDDVSLNEIKSATNFCFRTGVHDIPTIKRRLSLMSLALDSAVDENAAQCEIKRIRRRLVRRKKDLFLITGSSNSMLVGVFQVSIYFLLFPFFLKSTVIIIFLRRYFL